MNTVFKTRTIKQTIVSAIAISLMTLPLLASAGEKATGVFYSSSNLDNSTDQEILYARLKDASEEICGSSRLQVTGSVERITANKECYEGTLDAAVERLGNTEVKELHQQSS
jgi:UrcA family protein